MSGTRKSKPKGGNGPAPMTTADALGMLASAVNYCRLAGLEVRAGNTAAGLTLCLPAARLAQREAGAEFVPAEAQPEAAAPIA